MPYTKPNTFADGASLNASDIDGNDQALRKYINGEVVQADLANDAFDTPEIQLGEYQPITNEYTFATGIDTGNATGIEPEDRAYFTSNIKKGRQTDNSLFIWTASYHTGPEIYLEQTADVLITFGGTYVSQENDIAAKGFWDSQIKLAYTYGNNQQLTFVEQTRSYTFEEAQPTATVSGTFDPFGLTGKPSSALPGYELTEISYGLRRWIGWTMILRNLAPGSYKFSYYINAKVERGFTSARNFKAEVFYK